MDAVAQELLRGSPVALALWLVGRMAVKHASGAWAEWMAEQAANRASLDKIAEGLRKLADVMREGE